VVEAMARQIAAVVKSGAQMAVVIGGGNFFRGASCTTAAWTGPAPTTWACSAPS
jgi:uridylate kinase